MNKKVTGFIIIFSFLMLSNQLNGFCQGRWNETIDKKMPDILNSHRAFSSIPNISSNYENMYLNIDWVTQEFQNLDFEVTQLETSTLPVLLIEKKVNKKFKTVLFYMHLDGQDVDPNNWDQANPFIPVLKEKSAKESWEIIDWSNIEETINPDWRVFGRAVADDKAPIIMMISALEILKEQKNNPTINVKVILDLQEETSSEGFLETLEKYKSQYAADYLIIMDGPAHPSNEPTITFGCRGIATCSIRIYGAKLPQHSGHYGNYAPNPVFAMSHLLASMKNEEGKVLIEGYYGGVELSEEVKEILSQVPDNNDEIRKNLGINKSDDVGENYQESLQYPSLNVRQIETSWKGPQLKTIIPETATAYIDVRLVMETDGEVQLNKIKKHIESQGYLVLDRTPTNNERLTHSKIATYLSNPGVNAFRTDISSPFGNKIKAALEKEFGKNPVLIRTMGGTVPITPAINTLNIPAIIVPMVNMDNNQHNPNENIRIGNISQGIRTCLAILTTKF